MIRNRTKLLSQIGRITADRDKAERILNAFCPILWLGCSLRLQNKSSGSCCLFMERSNLSTDRCSNDARYFNNTEEIKEYRRMVLNGERPGTCRRCWDKEDSDIDNSSYRHYFLDHEDFEPLIDKILSQPADTDFDPVHLEVAFSSKCILACSYCNPYTSSRIEAEIINHGPYPLSNNRSDNYESYSAWDLTMLQHQNLYPVENPENSPYIFLFKGWFRQIYPNLRHLSFSGGEPSIDKEVENILDYIYVNPNEYLHLKIVSNIMSAEILFKNFFKKVLNIHTHNKIRKLTLAISIDQWGKRAEYIRQGLSFDRFITNFEYICNSFNNTEIVLACAFNILSVPQFDIFLENVLLFKKRFYRNLSSNKLKITLQISKLEFPFHQEPALLPVDFSSVHLDSALRVMLENRDQSGKGFDDTEIADFKSIISVITNKKIESKYIDNIKSDFYRYFSEYDRRNKTDILATFPELLPFWNECRTLSSRNNDK